MSREEYGRLGQFGLRHLLGLLTVVAVLLAITAPIFRVLAPDSQWVVSREALIVVLATLVVTGFLIYRRAKIERRAGPRIQRFERLSSRVWSWLIALLLWFGYLASAVFHDSTQFTPMLGSPYLLFWAINFTIIRLWWRLDPLGIELRERGLILGVSQFYAWENISRYSWSGSSPGGPPRQLNLFLKARLVLNVKVDASFVPPLERILAERVGA